MPMLADPVESDMSKQLYSMLVLFCRVVALTVAQNSGACTQNGLADRRALHRKYAPNQKSRHATMLVNLLTFDFGGDFMARLHAIEEANGEYESLSSDVFA